MSPEVRIRQDDGGYIAFLPGLPGCVSQGATIAEAGKNIVEAYDAVIESYGDKVPWVRIDTGPEPDELSSRIEFWRNVL